MRQKYLLGATKENELVFGEFEIINRNDYSKFSASFDTVRPFNGDEIDLVDYFSDVEWDYGKEWCYDQCEFYQCSPQDLPQELADACDDPRDAMDCSLYDECIEVDGNNWYFESSTCGQHDTREEIEVYTNKEAYILLIQLWDKYHLKNITNEQVQISIIIQSIISKLEKVDEEEWIRQYIKKTF